MSVAIIQMYISLAMETHPSPPPFCSLGFSSRFCTYWLHPNPLSVLEPQFGHLYNGRDSC